MYRNYIRNHPTVAAILLFLLIFMSVHVAQPKFLYNTDGSIRQFGVGFRNKTILPIWLLSIILGILCYLFVLYYLAHPKLSF